MINFRLSHTSNLCIIMALACLLLTLSVSAGNRQSTPPPEEASPGRGYVADRGVHGMEHATRHKDGRLVVKDRVSGKGKVEAEHVEFDGIVAPGNSPGCLSFGGNVTFNASATLSMELVGLTPCSEHDRLDVTNQLTINGATLEVILLGGYIPAYGDRFNLIDWGSLSGSFTTINTSAANLPPPLQWDTSQIVISGELIVTVQYFTDGDLAPWNAPDGLINAADALIATQIVLGQRIPGALQYAHGDMDTDGDIDSGDLMQILQIAF